MNYWPRPNVDDPTLIEGEVHVEYGGETHVLSAAAPGPIAAFVHAIEQLPLPTFTLKEYEEDAIGVSADAEAVAFIRLERDDDGSRFGVGFGSNIDQAAVRAVVAALNGLLDAGEA